MLGKLGGFLAAVAAHFIAHDAYSRCPKYARRLVERAVRQLPPFERERYGEEWLADVEEREGVLAKFEHAFLCQLSARTLRRFAEREPQRPAKMQFEVAGIDLVEVDLMSGLQALILIGDTFLEGGVKRRLVSEDDAKQRHSQFYKILTELGEPNKSELTRVSAFLRKLPASSTLVCRVNGVEIHRVNFGKED